MDIWLTTDTHFGHKKMVEFGRPLDYEARILNMLRHSLKNGDILIHLGDLAFDDYAIYNYDFCQRWSSVKKMLLLGNHDHKTTTWYLDNGWEFAGDTFTMTYYGKKIMFSHMPQDADVDINIHGHFHDNDHRTGDFPFYDKRHKLLALEHTNYKPVRLDLFINGKEGKWLGKN